MQGLRRRALRGVASSPQLLHIFKWDSGGEAGPRGEIPRAYSAESVILVCLGNVR
jgi:hypothetical protein